MASNNPKVIVIGHLGDAILTLKNPNTPFAVWKEASGAEKAAPESGVDSDGTKRKVVLGDKTLESRPKRQKPGASSPPCEENDVSQPDPDEGNVANTFVAYQVSSRHLVSGSAKFRSELIGPWEESRKGEDGLYHLSTSDCDSEAFEIFLNVLHLRNRQVPKELSLELFTKVAILVDYYRCWEAFDLISTVWLNHLQDFDPLPRNYGRELMLWMVIAWVFQLPEEFTETSRIALRENTEPHVQDMELGIPPAILSKIVHEQCKLLC
jgi:hypothetical protein